MFDSKSDHTGGAAAAAHRHIARAAMVLSAANDILQLTGASETTRTLVSRRAFDMALQALGEASAVLQSREVRYGR